MTSIPIPIINSQPPEKLHIDEEWRIDVHSVFHTCQGEGPFVGTPSVFLRTAGCNLQCPSCDTKYTAGRHWMTVPDLVKEVRAVGGKNTKLVIITGGEPFRQRLSLLIHTLKQKGYKVQIETNGTLYDDSISRMGTWEDVTVVCSPKTGSLHSELKEHITCLKYVVSEKKVASDRLPTESLGFGSIAGKRSEVMPARPWADFKGDIYLQPMDAGADLEQTLRNTQVCVDLCMKHGWRLCLQIHKLCGLP